MKATKIYRRGKVTRENSIFHKNGSVSCLISTNSHTQDEYFTIDASKFPLVEGRSWCVHNDRAHVGKSHFSLKSGYKGKVASLHWVLFYEETLAQGLSTDHLLHWTDNREASVEFISLEENQSRGAALYHPGRKSRASSTQKKRA